MTSTAASGRLPPPRRRRRKTGLALLAPLALLSLAAGHEHHHREAPHAAPPAPATAAAPAAGGGAVRGVIELPPDAKLPEDAATAPVLLENGFVPIQPPVVDPRTDMAVYLEPSTATSPAGPPDEPVSMTVSGSRLVPATLVVVPGTKVKFVVDDGDSHKLTTPDVPELLPPEEQSAGGKRERTAVFKVPGAYRIADQTVAHIHGIVLVKPAPYAANPDGQGSFAIAGVPDGSYTLQVFYEGEKPLHSQPVTVHGGGALTIKLPADLTGAGGGGH